MKNSFAALFLILCSAASAHASETFTVTGDKGAALLEALVAAGAKATVVVDASRFTVTDLDCAQGYQIGFGPFASCTFKEQIPVGGMSHAIFLRTFNASGEKARNLINALEDAGVKRHQGVESASYSVQSASCFGLVMGGSGHFGKSCDLSLAE
jgi:hypothetical protein